MDENNKRKADGSAGVVVAKKFKVHNFTISKISSIHIFPYRLSTTTSAPSM